MNKLILILGIIILAGGGYFVIQKQKTPSSVVKVEEGKSIDPKNIVEIFLKNIAEKKIPEAIVMMTKKAIPDEATKQAWGVQFNAFKKLTITSIEPSLQEEWTDSNQSYKVTMDVDMSPDSANGPIPYYGYEKGMNIRWVGLEKENSVWKITGIGTGP